MINTSEFATSMAFLEFQKSYNLVKKEIAASVSLGDYLIEDRVIAYEYKFFHDNSLVYEVVSDDDDFILAAVHFMKTDIFKEIERREGRDPYLLDTLSEKFT